MFAGGTCRMRSTSLPRRLSIATRRCRSATPVSRVVARLAFVAPLVVAGQPGHELLGVASFDVAEELDRRDPAQRRRMSTTVGDPHLSTPGCPFEAFRLPSAHHAQAKRRPRWRSSAIGGVAKEVIAHSNRPTTGRRLDRAVLRRVSVWWSLPHRGRHVDLAAVVRPIIGNNFLVTGCETNVCSIRCEWMGTGVLDHLEATLDALAGLDPDALTDSEIRTSPHPPPADRRSSIVGQFGSDAHAIDRSPGHG